MAGITEKDLGGLLKGHAAIEAHGFGASPT